MKGIEGYVSGEDDPLLKQFKTLYVVALVARAITFTPLKRAYVEGTREDRIAPFHRATKEVLTEASRFAIEKDRKDDDDDDPYRYTNRF